MPLHQDPVLGYRVGVPYAARVYDAVPAPKNMVSLQGPLRKVYSISNVYATKHGRLYLVYTVFAFRGFLCVPTLTA